MCELHFFNRIELVLLLGSRRLVGKKKARKSKQQRKRASRWEFLQNFTNKRKTRKIRESRDNQSGTGHVCTSTVCVESGI